MGRIVVVGSGMAGLSAAYALTRAGREVLLVEADTVPGGRLATRDRIAIERDGRRFSFPLEHGIHGVWRPYLNLRRLMTELGTAHTLVEAPFQELISEQRGRVTYAEVGARIRTAPLPSLIAAFALGLEPMIARDLIDSGPAATAKVIRDLATVLSFDPSLDAPHYDEIAVADFIRGWPELVRRLFESLTHQGFFQDADRVSLAAFLTGVAFYVTNDKRDTAFDLFGEPPEASLIEPILDLVRRRGEVRLDTRAVRVLHDRQAASAVLLEEEGRKKEEPADAVVLALDPPGLRALSAGDPMLVPADAEVPKGVPSAAARLWFSTTPAAHRHATGVFAGGDADNFFWLDRIQRPYRAWREEIRGSVLECHLYGRRAERATVEPEAEVLERVRRTALRAWPELTGTEVQAHLLVNPATHVAFAPGLMGRLPPADCGLSNVFLAGDFIDAPFPCLYLERATVTGWTAARRISGAGVPPLIPPRPLARSVRWVRPLLRRMVRRP